MGFSFNFFGKQEVRRFNYRPRFYDPEEEARKAKLGDNSKKKKEYVPGELVRGSLRDGNYKDSHDVTSNQKYLGMLTLLLLFAVVFALFKYFPLLLESMEQDRVRQETEQMAPEGQKPRIEDPFEIVNLN